MATVQVLEDILANKAKDISNGNRKIVVEVLQELFAEGCDSKQVVTYLLKFHYAVCQSFFEAFALSNSDDSIINVAEALINDERFKKSSNMYYKGFLAVVALASKEKFQPAFLVLNCILSESEKLGGFSEGCLNNYKKLVFDKDGQPFISVLLTRVKDGTVTCKEFEQKRLIRFFKALEDKIVTISDDTKKDESMVFAQKLSEENPGVLVPTTDESQESIAFSEKLPEQSHQIKQSSNLSQNADATEMLVLGQFVKKQQDILKMLHKLADNHSIIESLSAALSHRDAENSIIWAGLSEKDQHIAILDFEITKKDKQLNDAEIKITDLTERLRNSLQMDHISKNQEMITLKNEISEALKLDYEDFVKSKENPYSQDLFEAYRATLNRVFKLLKRFEITCQ